MPLDRRTDPELLAKRFRDLPGYLSPLTDAVNRYRAKHKLTQERLAQEVLKVTPPRLSLILHGRSSPPARWRIDAPRDIRVAVLALQSAQAYERYLAIRNQFLAARDAPEDADETIGDRHNPNDASSDDDGEEVPEVVPGWDHEA